MQVRISRVVRDGKTYEYAQLVESYRRASDGMPTHRVLASLGALAPTEIQNLKAALAASREGKRVAVVRAPRAVSSPKILDNLRYLDLAVLLELWNEWGLTEIIDEVLPSKQSEVSTANVVAALVLQRCVAPSSKLAATQWFPRTALPELLGLQPDQFNNTRLHRVLDELDAGGAALMAKLPRRIHECDGAFVSLFLDVTDTWFVGEGPDLAERGKTKEGFVRKKIGIVLLCNESGYPLRWEVVQGTAHDSRSMTAMIDSVAKLRWAAKTPIVCDRAMGKTAQIRTLANSGLYFVTALTTTEFPTYAEALPTFEADTAEAAASAAIAAGMQKVDDTLYVSDLGAFERVEAQSTPAAEAATPRRAMQLARNVEEAVNSGSQSSYTAAGRALGIRSKEAVAKYRLLCRLDEGIQREVLVGKADHFTLAELISIAKLPANEQWTAFRSPSRKTVRVQKPLAVAVAAAEAAEAVEAVEVAESFHVRVLAYFNPERFETQRASAQSELDQIQSFVADLNASLSSSRSRRTRDSVVALVDRTLRDAELLGAFEVSLAERSIEGRLHYSVAIQLNEREWVRRRRYDGFTVLVAHPALPQSATEICQLYRAKDAVEKDFQVIKSVVELRPVHHRTDGKVRAHVTLCMLALLLERTLTRRLDGHLSAKAAIELLAPCHLNRLVAGTTPLLLFTEPTAQQRDLLRQLGMQELATDDAVDRLQPR